MDSNLGRRSQGSRCVALVGPYLSGKTTLLEAILFRTGATQAAGQNLRKINHRRCVTGSARARHER